MAKSDARYLRVKIARLRREIAEIQRFLYRTDEEGDQEQYAFMLERKRDDAVRSAVLQMHTSIEEVLVTLIEQRVLRYKERHYARAERTVPARALRDLLSGPRSLGFEKKIELAIALRIIGKRVQHQLLELNTLRNRCSHNWVLKTLVRRKRRPKESKLPLLRYRGADLHRVSVLEDFVARYANVYVRLWGRSVGALK